MDTLTISELLLINIQMEKDFPEKPSIKKDIIEPTKSNVKRDTDTMIHPSSSTSPPAFRDVSASNNGSPSTSPGSTVGTLVGKPVDPNHFPTHLYRMLEQIDNSEGHASQIVDGRTFVSICSWQPHGKCFLIHDEDLFSKYVLPKYFCRLKFTSFQRQLHFHGFKRLCKQGPDKGAYYHDLFARGMAEVATYIQRIKSTKGLRGRKRKSQDQEPDFYKQSPPSMAAMIAKANRAATGAPEPPKLSLPTNEAPSQTGVGDSTEMVRLEPTPIGQMRSPQAGTPSHGEFQNVRAAEGSPNKRQRQDVAAPRRNTTSEESKFNVGVAQQLLQQQREVDSLRDLRSELMGPSLTRSSSLGLGPTLGPSRSGSLGLGSSFSNLSNEDDLWQLGMFAMSDRGDTSMPLGQTNMPPLFSHVPTHDLEPTPLQIQQEQQPLQGPGPVVLDQQRQQHYDAEDQLQQHILRQIDEQQRQLLQQRQEILQRQQLQSQQRQLAASLRGHQESFTMQQALQQQQQQQSLHQHQALALPDNLYPYQEQQGERLQILGDIQQQRAQQQQQQQGGSSQHQMHRFPKHGGGL